jgi:hypothetical protein
MRTRWRALLAAGLALAGGCSPQYELLRRSPEAEAGGSAAGGTDSGGATLGGGTSAAGASSGEVPGAGGAEPMGTAGESAGGACGSHLDCDAGTVCSASQCVACPAVPATCAGPCDHGFQPQLAAHNDCVVCECAPSSECTSNTDCPAGEECYLGAQCQAGCAEPACCTGNQCSPAGCAGAPIPHCLAAGCAGGALCLAACNAVSCECDGASWKCAESPSAGGALGDSCPQACVSP